MLIGVWSVWSALSNLNRKHFRSVNPGVCFLRRSRFCLSSTACLDCATSLLHCFGQSFPNNRCFQLRTVLTQEHYQVADKMKFWTTSDDRFFLAFDDPRKTLVASSMDMLAKLPMSMGAVAAAAR